MIHYGMTPLKTDPKQTMVFPVTKTTTRMAVTQSLVNAGIIEDASKFLWLGRLTRHWGKMKAGEYEFSSDMSPLEIFKVLSSGISMGFPITVHEGDNFYQVADAIQNKGFATREEIIALCKNPTFIESLQLGIPASAHLEGYLFPETYTFSRGTSGEMILKKMVALFKSKWTPEREAKAKEKKMTRHQVVILASMIEKETGAAHERPMISSVFHNRLSRHMRLESDPTTIYGIWERYKGNITRADLQEMTPYNTYKVPALPAGPISNPGVEAIDAALSPAVSEYLFFVSHNDGTHAFTRSFAEHQAAVKKFQIDPTAREGKSWRDLKATETRGKASEKNRQNTSP